MSVLSPFGKTRYNFSCFGGPQRAPRAFGAALRPLRAAGAVLAGVIVVLVPAQCSELFRDMLFDTFDPLTIPLWYCGTRG